MFGLCRFNSGLINRAGFVRVLAASMCSWLNPAAELLHLRMCGAGLASLSQSLLTPHRLSRITPEECRVSENQGLPSLPRARLRLRKPRHFSLCHHTLAYCEDIQPPRQLEPSSNSPMVVRPRSSNSVCPADFIWR
jgi:hypothetical protein